MKPSDQARWQGSVDSWLAQGQVQVVSVSPVAGTLMADTGALVSGWYDFTIILAATGDHYYADIQHRNAANSSSIHWWRAIWGSYKNYPIPINNWYMAANERLRILVGSDSDDNLITNIHWVKRV